MRRTFLPVALFTAISGWHSFACAGQSTNSAANNETSRNLRVNLLLAIKPLHRENANSFFDYADALRFQFLRSRTKEVPGGGNKFVFSGAGLSPSEQQEIANKYFAEWKARMATRVVQGLGGPFRASYFFNSRELINPKNVTFVSYLSRRDGWRMPICFSPKKQSQRQPILSLVIQQERWPEEYGLQRFVKYRSYQKRITGSVGIEIDMDRALSGMKSFFK